LSITNKTIDWRNIDWQIMPSSGVDCNTHMSFLIICPTYSSFLLLTYYFFFPIITITASLVTLSTLAILIIKKH
jgi:hypothetical protein